MTNAKLEPLPPEVLERGLRLFEASLAEDASDETLMEWADWKCDHEVTLLLAVMRLPEYLRLKAAAKRVATALEEMQAVHSWECIAHGDDCICDADDRNAQRAELIRDLRGTEE